LDDLGRPRLAHSQGQEDQDKNLQLNLFGALDNRLKKWIGEIDISSMTPLEALVELNKIKEYVEK